MIHDKKIPLEAVDYERAAELIEGGFGQHNFGFEQNIKYIPRGDGTLEIAIEFEAEDDGKYCYVGALRKAQFERKGLYSLGLTNEAALLWGRMGERGLPWAWNDHPLRTSTEVSDKLIEGAKFLRDQGE